MKKILMILLILMTDINAETNSLSIPKGYSISYEINHDITNDGVEDKVYVLKSKDKIKNPYLLIIMDNIILLKSSLVIPIVQSSPYVEFFQEGFDISIGTKNVLYDVKSEGVKFSIKESDEKTLVLTSRQDGAPYSFKFYFTYIKKSRNFKLRNIYLISFNESCDHSLNAVYEVKSKVFKNMLLKDFDGNKIHQFLYKKSVWINKEMQLYKIQSIELLSLYNEIFKLYKNKNINFKEYVGSLLVPHHP